MDKQTLQAQLRSGLDNCDTDSQGIQLGGIVQLMNDAADAIDALEAEVNWLMVFIKQLDAEADRLENELYGKMI
jgi:hypothetical protein